MTPPPRKPPAAPPPVALNLALLLRRLQRLDAKASQLLNTVNRTPQP